MISTMGLTRCRDGLTGADLKNALRASRPLAPEGLRGHVQNVIVDRTQRGIEYARGALEVDCFDQFMFQHLSTTVAAADVRSMYLAAGLQEHDLEDVTIITTLRNTVIHPPKASGTLKRMSLLRKRSDVSFETFQEEWFNVHSVLVKRLPGIRGYRQNLVLDAPRTDGDFSVDGVVELWFQDAESIERAFRSDIGATTMTHAKEFISEITTYLVDPVEIVSEH